METRNQMQMMKILKGI